MRTTTARAVGPVSAGPPPREFLKATSRSSVGVSILDLRLSAKGGHATHYPQSTSALTRFSSLAGGRRCRLNRSDGSDWPLGHVRQGSTDNRGLWRDHDFWRHRSGEAIDVDNCPPNHVNDGCPFDNHPEHVAFGRALRLAP